MENHRVKSEEPYEGRPLGLCCCLEKGADLTIAHRWGPRVWFTKRFGLGDRVHRVAACPNHRENYVTAGWTEESW